MAAVAVCSDFRAQEEEICHYFHIVPLCLPWSNETGCIILCFFIVSFKPFLSLSSSPSSRDFSFFLCTAIRVLSFTYLRLLMSLLPILISACNSSSLTFLVIYSAYRLNKQDDSRQTCYTPFSILNQSVVPYRVLIAASWTVCWFLRRQIIWSRTPISLRTSHSFLWFTQPKAMQK